MVPAASTLSSEEQTAEEGSPEGPALPDSRLAQTGALEGRGESLSLRQRLRSVTEALGF